MKKELPNQTYLNSILEYKDGILYWKISPAKNIKPGDVAGCFDRYFRITINNERYALHNIIWKMITGNEPEFIDHIDHNPLNNNIENLRNVSHQENTKNRSKSKNNTSGYNNIIILKTGKSIYKVKFNSEKYQKSFLTLEEAIQHRDKKYLEFGYYKNHGN